MTIRNIPLILFLLLGSFCIERIASSLPENGNSELLPPNPAISDAEVGLQSYTNIFAGKNFATGNEDFLDFGATAGLGLSQGTNVGAGLGLNSNVGAAADLEAGLYGGAGLGVGVNAGAGLGAGLYGGAGLGVGLNAGAGLGAELNAGAGLGVGVNAGVGLGVGVNAGAGLYAGAGLGAGLNAGAGLGAGLYGGAGLGVGLNAGAGLGAGLNVDASLGATLNANLLSQNNGIFLVSDIDLSASKEALAVFNTELKLNLQKDKYFRYVFCEYISSNTLKLIIDSMIQYISEAFSIPPAYFLPLENKVKNVPSDIKPSVEFYSDVIVTSLTDIFSTLNIITLATAKLQASTTVKAIASAIVNFLRTSSFPEINVNDNIYGSYFSELNGLGKLPYVGTDAIVNLPPILKTALALKSAQKFEQILFNRLISSSVVSQVFLLGLPASNLKITSIALGINMAETFGSFDSAFFSNIYSTTLLITAKYLNCNDYIRAISLATRKALYLLGYFSSGDVSIQAAIAFGAIIRTLTAGLKSTSTQVVLFPGVLTLPSVTQLTGLALPQDFLKLGIGAGAGVSTALETGLAIDTGIGIGAAVGAGIDAGVGLGIGANLGADARLGANLGADASLGATLGTSAALEAGTALGLQVGANGDSVNAQLSILNVLRQILSNKFYRSIALSTSIKIVGCPKVIDLIAQSIAHEFGFPIAAVFLNSYDKNYTISPDTSIIRNVIALAAAMTDVLANLGILNSKFTVQIANQLATAVDAKISSLITTSLESADWNTRRKWTFWPDQDRFQPPLTDASAYYLFQ